jgi:hypothetical protein
MVVHPHAYDTTHNVPSRRELLHEQPIRQRNSPGPGGAMGAIARRRDKSRTPTVPTKAITNIATPIRRIIASPLFHTNAAAPSSSLGLRTSRTTAKVLKPKTERVSESATVRGPTQRVDANRLPKLGSTGNTGIVLGRRPKLIAIASGGGVKIDRARKFHGALEWNHEILGGRPSGRPR